jgi:hypothetical protein
MKASGIKTKDTAKVRRYGRMARGMMDSGKKVRLMGMDD